MRRKVHVISVIHYDELPIGFITGLSKIVAIIGRVARQYWGPSMALSLSTSRFIHARRNGSATSRHGQ